MKLGVDPIRVCTTAGQSVTPPDPKLLPEQPCDPGVRELIGSLLFLSRCTRFDLILCYRTARKICHTLVRVIFFALDHSPDSRMIFILQTIPILFRRFP